jgi:hypothetical protein
LELGSLGQRFDSVLDCGLFHVFDDNERAAFVASLTPATAVGGRDFMLCFSEHQPGGLRPPRFTQAVDDPSM